MEAPALAQRGRASLDFQAGISKATFGLHFASEAELAMKGVNAQTMPDDMDERHALVVETLADSKIFKIRELFGEWASRTHGAHCDEAFEERRAVIEPYLKSLDEGPATLDYGDGEQAPSYWSKVWFHRTTGGWDHIDHTGYVHGELVHKQLVARGYGGDIFGQRRAAAQQAPRRDYKEILDIGCGSGHFTQALQETFPEAQITGIDWSARMLEQARRVANEKGWNWKLMVKGGENSGFADESFDLVTTFILFHEAPPRIIKSVLEEAFRMLKPGGDIIMADVPRYAEIDKMASWRYDYLAKWGGEPYWRASASMDLVQICKDIGYVDVEGATQAPSHAYYVLRAHKPA